MRKIIEYTLVSAPEATAWRKALILPPRSSQSMGMPGQCPVRTRLGLLVLGIAVIRGWLRCRPSPTGRS